MGGTHENSRVTSPESIPIHFKAFSNRADLDEMAHYEPPHQDRHCLQILLFLSVALNPITLRVAKTYGVLAVFSAIGFTLLYSDQNCIQ